MADTPAAAPTVTDNRPTPRGVLPRHTQTWLMVGLAVVILGIIVLTGRPTPAPRAAATTNVPPIAPSADRLREYQDRLRVLDERARQQPIPSAATPAKPEPVPRGESPRREAPPDAIEQEQKRREYASLFASNVVVSHRVAGDRLTTAADLAPNPRQGPPTLDTPTARPSLDDVADAVVRASARHGQATLPGTRAPEPPAAVMTAPPAAASRLRAATGSISSSGPLHRLNEGTVIDTVLTNRIDGAAVAPVNCLVTNPVYSHDGRFVLIPAGSRVLGETKAVQAFGESRLAVAFNRLVLPDGSTYPLEQFVGLNAIGDAGLRDQVNQHYRSTFGASVAVGLISGFAQLLGSAAFGRSANTVVIAGDAAESTAQATSQTMNRFLNRLPTITIREGHRVKVYLTNDLELPVYLAPDGRGALVANGR
jgi:type IV secretory pathway VirB10-like protein